MTHPQPDHMSSWMNDIRVWRRSAIALLSASAVWLIVSWAAIRGWLTVTYEIDVPATLLLAFLLLSAGLLALWRVGQLESSQGDIAHKQWLSVLLVKRDEAEQAVQALESINDSLESLERAWLDTPEHAAQPVMQDSSRLKLISPELEPVLSLQTALNQQMQALQARLINLQVKFGRGDSLDALAYDLNPLSHEYRQLESALNQLFIDVQTIELARADQLNRYCLELNQQDPYAPWRELLESALQQTQQARQALARSLDQPPPMRTRSLDQYLGLRP